MPLAKLVGNLDARKRITEPFWKEDRWDDKRGFYQVVINKAIGQEWDVGTKYDVEGYIKQLNKDIEAGMYH